MQKPMTTAQRISPCQICNCQRMDLVNMRLGLDAVSLAAARGDQVAAEFLANAEDMNIEEVGNRVVIFVEQMLVERGPGDDFAAMQWEIFEDRVFARGERDRFTCVC